MIPVEWTPQALDDVQAIREHIARESAQYDELMAQRFFRAVERLQHFPDSGRMVPEYARPDLPEVLERMYRLPAATAAGGDHHGVAQRSIAAVGAATAAAAPVQRVRQTV